MVSNAQTQGLRENLRLRSDLVFSLPGARLEISLYVRFAARNAACLVISANDQLLRTVSAFDYGPGGDENGTGTKNEGEVKRSEAGQQKLGDWTLIAIEYTAHDRLLQLSLSYQLDSASANTIWLDQVAISPSLGAPRPPQPPPVTTFATAVRPAA
jgi:hypothetical protein